MLITFTIHLLIKAYKFITCGCNVRKSRLFIFHMCIFDSRGGDAFEHETLKGFLLSRTVIFFNEVSASPSSAVKEA